MNEVVKYWDENLVAQHVGIELNWLFNHLDLEDTRELNYVDIGGNVGKFYDELIKKYSVKKAIIIEPSKILFDYMSEKFKGISNVELHNFAISDSNGMVKFIDSAQNVTEFFEEKGISNSMNLGLSKLNRMEEGSTQCYSMDYFLRNICSIEPKKINFIKIDTENTDLFIIKNMTDFFIEKQIKPFILFENNYHNDMSRSEALEIIERFCQTCGYEPVDLSIPGDSFLKPKKSTL